MKKSVVAVAFVFLAGCATTRTVTVKQPMTEQFSKYSSLRIEYEPSDVEQAMPYYNQFAAKLKKELEAGHYFRTVTTEKGANTQLAASCKITNVDRPSQAMTMLTKGAQNSTVTFDVTFHETKSNRAVASLEVMGNSANRHRSSIGGISLTSSNDLTTAAVEEAATAVASYVQQNMTPTSHTAQK